MKTLGITGGIGSGKTTVCCFLESLGAEVFYADLEAKKIQVEDLEAKAEIQAVFGAAAYEPDGSLNRPFLAKKVFENKDLLQKLNQIVHPRVRARLLARKKESQTRGIPLLGYEAALIYETGGEQYVDAVLVVYAPQETRIARVKTRDQVSEAQVLARMQHQLSEEELRARADFTIENKGDLADLEARVRDFWQAFVGD